MIFCYWVTNLCCSSQLGQSLIGWFDIQTKSRLSSLYSWHSRHLILGRRMSAAVQPHPHTCSRYRDAATCSIKAWWHLCATVKSESDNCASTQLVTSCIQVQLTTSIRENIDAKWISEGLRGQIYIVLCTCVLLTQYWYQLRIEEHCK